MGSQQQTGQSGSQTGADFNIRMLRPLARYVVDHHGLTALEAILQGSPLNPDDLLTGKRWISIEQMERFFAQVYTLVGQDEDAMRTACAHRMAEAYGPLKALLWAVTPKGVSRTAMRNVHVASANGRWRLLEEGRSWIRVRYESHKPESRLLCLGRQANIITMPTMWGLQPAVLQERRCTARGDDCCEYHVRWQTSWRWTIPAVGVTGGLLFAWGLVALGLGSPAMWIAMALTGGLLANSLELFRVHRTNREFAEHSHAALEEIARQEADARQEILALNKRQQDWLRMLEEQIAERAHDLEGIVAEMQAAQAERTVTLRGFSHDLRSPLTVLRAMSEYIQQRPEEPFEDWPGFGNEHAEAVEQLIRLVQAFADAIGSDRAGVAMRPAPVQVKPLTETLRRRMKAMVFGRGVSVSVFATREAPEQITIDRMVFDRILDNLMTNAAKYTERGSIIIEIGGTPGYLSLKVSDTGRGMDEGLIERIFDPAGPQAKQRSWESWGLGLSVVVKLLERVGGRLEVMSKPGLGTTFWIYLPAAAASERADGQAAEERDDGRPARKVVTIRKESAS